MGDGDVNIDDDYIEKEVQRELDALSLNENEDCDEIDKLDYQEPEVIDKEEKGYKEDFSKSLQLFLKNAEQRKVYYESNLSEADEALLEAHECIQSSRSIKERKNLLCDIIDKPQENFNNNNNNESPEIIKTEGKEDFHLEGVVEEKCESFHNFFNNHKIPEDKIVFSETKSENDKKHDTDKIKSLINLDLHTEEDDALDDDLERVQQLMDDINEEKNKIAEIIKHDEQTKAAIVLQAYYRGHSARINFFSMLREEKTRKEQNSKKHVSENLSEHGKKNKEPVSVSLNMEMKSHDDIIDKIEASVDEGINREDNAAEYNLQSFEKQAVSERNGVAEVDCYISTVEKASENVLVTENQNNNVDLKMIEDNNNFDKNVKLNSSKESNISKSCDFDSKTTEPLLNKNDDISESPVNTVVVITESHNTTGDDVKETVPDNMLNSSFKCSTIENISISTLINPDSKKNINIENNNKIDSSNTEIKAIKHVKILKDKTEGIPENNNSKTYDNDQIINKNSSEILHSEIEENIDGQIDDTNNISNKHEIYTSTIAQGKEDSFENKEKNVTELKSQSDLTENKLDDLTNPNDKTELEKQSDNEIKNESGNKNVLLLLLENDDQVQDTDNAQTSKIDKNNINESENINCKQNKTKEQFGLTIEPSFSTENFIGDESVQEPEERDWKDVYEDLLQEKLLMCITMHSESELCNESDLLGETKTSIPVRRIIRKSSAAKRLPSFKDDEMLRGALDFVSDNTAIENIQILYICQTDSARNLGRLLSCIHLTHLSLINCGLLSVEGLQGCPVLKFIDVSHNSINIISCSGMLRLEVFVACNNKLTSIHGLDNCRQLTCLDLSYNNITKVSGISDAKELTELRLSNNQLMNIEEIKYNMDVLHLDISHNHISSLDSLKNCKKLKIVNCSNNNLSDDSFGCLNSLIFLSNLDISCNNLVTLKFLNDTWLPFLIDLNISRNTINLAVPPGSKPFLMSVTLPMLSIIDISENLFYSLKDLKELFTNSENLQILKCYKVLPSEEYVKELELSLQNIVCESTELCKTDENQSKPQYFNEFNSLYKLVKPIDDGGILVKNLRRLLLEVKRLTSKYHKKILKDNYSWQGKSNNKDALPITCFANYCKFLKDLTNITSHQMKMLLSGSFHRLSYVNYSSKYINSEGQNTKDTFKEKPINDNDDTLEKATAHGPINYKKINNSLSNFDSFSNSQNAKAEKASDEKDSFESSLFKSSVTLKKSVSKVTADVVMTKLHEEQNIEEIQNQAAIKVQSVFRGYRVRRGRRKILKWKNDAAVSIQSLWRGFSTRRKLQNALEVCNKKTSEHFMMNDSFDIEEFEFDEDKFDEEWNFNPNEVIKTPQPNNDSLFSHQDSFHQSFSQSKEIVPKIPVVKQSWMEEKPPLPPVPRSFHEKPLHKFETSESDYAPSSKQSSKKEVLASEWGLKDSNTAALMLKRARKMKGGRKKNLTADQKFAHFRDKVVHSQNVISTPPRSDRSSQNKKAFKFQQYAYPGDVVESKYTPEQMLEDKTNYTYEWLHSPANIQKKPKPIKQSSSVPGFLPHIPRSPSLVAAHDLEVVSVSSVGSKRSRKDVLLDIALKYENKQQRNNV